MHFILCRNVMIYFNRQLQHRVFDLIDRSLIHNGFLCLGTKESLMFSEIDDHYVSVGDKEKLYRKRTP